ncbi:hypothetical protein ACI68E_001145 [Malassezia pachydermatis]|uniref:Ubiquitin-like domain-containing protein n=1 Tax=Malassezia pachydermatis TaxID=77020 RepID=A0A0M9VNC7_9BASI|nr:hypothetical protein Malapachy_1616 [Malassezia pachydermatis]KOS13209.1 hypothetical protein Malapachy_1616 [Malassezia pachydermatis]
MATRPRPRVFRKTSSLSGTTKSDAGLNTYTDDSFFVASRARTNTKLLVDDEVDSSFQPSPETAGDLSRECGDDIYRHRRKRKALDFDWVSQEPHTTSHTDVQRLSVETPLSPSAANTLARATTLSDSLQNQKRDLSISPPPPDFEKEAQIYAQNAIAQVTSEHREKLAALQVDLGLWDDNSSDTSFELNAGLAQYYRGHDAHKLREQAIAREKAREEQLAQQETTTNVVQVSDDDEAPSQAPIYIVDDSSDEEPTVSSTQEDTAVSAPQPSAFAQEDPDTLLVTLRGARQLDVQVKVRATTRMDTMLMHFLQTHASSLTAEEKAKARLYFEGELLSMTSSVQDIDLEDGDMLDVMW